MDGWQIDGGLTGRLVDWLTARLIID